MESNWRSWLHSSQRSCSHPIYQRQNDLVARKTLALCPRRIKGYEEIFYLCPPYVFIFNSNFRGGNLSNAIAHFSNSQTSDAVEIVKQIKTSNKLAPTLKCTLTFRRTYQQANIDELINPSINFVGYAPKNDLEKLAMGNALKCVHLDCTSGIY